MNLILLEPGELAAEGTNVRIVGRRARHIREVLRAEPGRELGVGVIDGKIGSATVCHIDVAAVELEIGLTEEPPPPSPVTLFLALPRPKALRRLLQGVAAMGVKRILLINCWRVEKSYWASPLLSEAALRETLLLGLEQARDTMLPAITLHQRFRPFVEDDVPGLIEGSRALVGDLAAIQTCPTAVTEPTSLAIGPEGGFIPFELEMLQQTGFERVSLGRRSLRVEHAVPAFLGRLLAGR